MASAIGREPMLDRTTYYAEAQSWHQDVNERLRRSRKLAWIVAGVASGCAALGLLTAAMLAPIKTVVPFVVEVDRSTGYTRVARELAPGTLTQDEAVTQANLVNYVLARETIDATDIEENYGRTLLWSDGDAKATYLAQWQKGTPTSLVDKYPLGTVVAVAVKNVSLLNRNTALVRYLTTLTAPGGKLVAEQHWASVIGFRYSDRPLSMEDRFVNPLGFQVVSYRRDPETPELGAAAAPSAHAAPAAVVPASARGVGGGS